MGRLRVCGMIGVFLLAVPAHALTLDGYLQQVRDKNLGIKSSQETVVASELAGSQAKLFFRPSLITQARIGRDGSVMNPPMLAYDRLDTQSYSLGVAQQFSFGLQARAGYELSSVSYVGASFPQSAGTTFYDARPVLELSMPLWKNGFGRLSRANRDAVVAQSEAGRYGATARERGLIVQAESGYWRLAAAREVVQLQKRALQQAESILEYVSRKAAMNLGNDADVLQAQALVEARRLELSQAESEERTAARSFNTLRFSEDDSIDETLDQIRYEELQAAAVPSKRPGERADVLASQAESRLQLANAVASGEQNKPNLELFGTYALNGHGNTANDALSGSYTSRRDTAVVGLRLSMPLDLGSMSDTVKSGEHGARAAELSLQQKSFEQDREWTEWVRRMEDAKLQLGLAKSMVAAQKAKLDREKTRLREGRATTYQVLLFEQDYSQAELARVRIAAQILALRAQLNLYMSSENGGQ